MGYNDCEVGLLDVIRLLPNYGEANSSQGDYRILASGDARNLVLHPGSILSREVMAAPRRISTLWEIEIELYISFVTDIKATSAQLREDRQEVLDQVDKYPTLDGVPGVVTALIMSGRPPMMFKGESRNWWVQILVCHVRENTTVSIAELS